MSWRTRKQDIYTNHGKLTTTTLQPSMSSRFYKVTQDAKVIGQQGTRVFEGVFELEEAEETFMNLVTDAHTEVVEAPGYGQVLAGVIDEDGETP